MGAVRTGDLCETDSPWDMFKYTLRHGTNVVIRQPQRTLCLIPTNILFTRHILQSASRGSMILAWPCIIHSCAAVHVCARFAVQVCSFLYLVRFVRPLWLVFHEHTIHTIVTSPRPAVQSVSALPLGGTVMLNYSPHFE